MDVVEKQKWKAIETEEIRNIHIKSHKYKPAEWTLFLNCLTDEHRNFTASLTDVSQNTEQIPA